MSIYEDLEEVLKKHGKIMKQTAYATFEIHDEPEPEVIIKQSGGTWVARYDGVDYLMINGILYGNKTKIDFFTFREEWKPIPEIEITDEIAKLRPIVIDESRRVQATLIGSGFGVSKSCHIIEYKIYNGNEICYSRCVRLATVDDLP